MAHGENLRVLMFEENASEAGTLANLPYESGHLLQTGLVSVANRPGNTWKQTSLMSRGSARGMPPLMSKARLHNTRQP